MRPLSDDVVITEGNAAFQRVMDALSADEPLRLVLCGPKGAGKSTVMQARGREKDLLSQRKALYAHGQEIMAAIDLEVNESLLEQVAQIDLLLLDGLDTLTDQGERGAQMAALLVAERNRQGLGTVLGFDGAAADLDLALFGGALDGFEVAEVAPLDRDGLIEYGRRMAARHGEADDAPQLTDEALAALADRFADDPAGLGTAVRFLLTARGFDAGHAISAADVAEALAS